MKDLSAFITYKDLVAEIKTVKVEFHQDLKDVDGKVGDVKKELGGVNMKVDNLKDIVIPMVENFKHLVENTKRTNVILEEYVKEQRLTNGLTGEKMHKQDLEIEGLKHISNGVAEKKKSSAVIIVAVITIVPALMGALYTIVSSMDLFK